MSLFNLWCCICLKADSGLNAHFLPVCSPRFVDYMEQRVPAGDVSGMSLVFDSLVQRFLNVERYADDIRYVNYCIKCVSLSDMLHYRPAVALFFQTIMALERDLTLSCRRVIIPTLLLCTATSMERASAPGPPPSTWPGRSSLSRGGWLTRPRPCSKKRWRTKRSQSTLFSANTGNNK